MTVQEKFAFKAASSPVLRFGGGDKPFAGSASLKAYGSAGGDAKYQKQQSRP